MFSSLDKYQQDDTINHEVFTPAEEPVLVTIGGKDVALTLTLASQDCDAVKAARARFQNLSFRRMADTNKGLKRFDRAEDGARNELQVAVLCTRGWNLHDGGEPVPFSAENVKALYEHKKFPYILDQVLRVTGDRKAFDPLSKDDEEDESGNS